MELRFTRVVGRMGEGVWVGVDQYRVEGLGELVAVVTVESESQYVNLAAFAKAVVHKLVQGLEKSEATVVERVRTALVEASEAVESVEVSLGVVVYTSEWVVLGSRGAGGVWLKRDGKVARLGTGAKGRECLVGKGKVGDEYVIVNGQFERALELMGNGQEAVGVQAEMLAVELERSGVVGGGAAVVELYEPEEQRVYQGVNGGSRMFWRGWGLKLKGEGLRVFGQRRAHRDRLVITIVGLLMVLAVVVGWAWWRGQVRVREAEFEAVVAPVEQLVSEAQGIGISNRAVAMGKLQQALVLVEGVMADDRWREGEINKLIELGEKTQSEYVLISGEQQIEPEVFYDLNLIADGFYGDKMSIAGEELVVFDRNKAMVAQVDVVNKAGEVVYAGDEVRGMLGVAGDEERVYGLTSEGVIELGEAVEVIIPREEVWNQVVLIGAFGERVYLVDTGVSELWRYRDSGGWTRQRWLAPGVAPDFTQVVDMVIDGSIWLVNRNGVVREYVAGVSSGFGQEGFDEEVEATSLAVTETRVLVLDQKKARIIEFDHEGVYQRQWLSQVFASASDMVAGDGGVLVLSGSILYQVEL